ncbi:hypothetical protein HK102_006516, partial [Quaeritorhiza haematococci]
MLVLLLTSSICNVFKTAPPWCGMRYSKLNAASITAISGINANMCNQCLEVQAVGGGPTRYVLIVDQKGAPGLDIALTSFSALFPGKNPLDPQTCQWRITDWQRCQGVCFGNAAECSTGVRNLLPPYLLAEQDGSGSVAQSAPAPPQPQQVQPPQSPAPAPVPAPSPSPAASPSPSPVVP